MTDKSDRRSIVQAVGLTATHESFIKAGVPSKTQAVPLYDEVSDGELTESNSDSMDEMLVPITTKLRRRTYQALRRAYLQQKLRNRRPATQQEIVEAAVAEWLSANRFSV